MSNKLKPWQGLVIFVLVFLTLITAGAVLQINLGIIGLVLSELLLVLVAVGLARVFSADIKEAVPLKLPPIKSFFGGAMLYVGTFAIITPVSLLLQILFPQGFEEVSSELGNIMTSVSPAVGIFVFALIPAICEEIIMRGVILSSMKSIKSKAVISAIIGVMFGILHTDPFRFFQTAMIGGIFAYIALETESIILPVIFHFLNNSFSLIVTHNAKDVEQAIDTSATVTSTYSVLTVIGVSLFYIAIAIPLFYFGFCLIKNKKPRVRGVIITVILAVVMFFSGVVITAVSSTKTLYYEMPSASTAITVDGSAEKVCDFVLEEDGTCFITITSICNGGMTAYKLRDESGNIISEAPYDESISENLTIELKKGKYTLTIYATEENDDSDATLVTGIIVLEVAV